MSIKHYFVDHLPRVGRSYSTRTVGDVKVMTVSGSVVSAVRLSDGAFVTVDRADLVHEIPLGTAEVAWRRLLHSLGKIDSTQRATGRWPGRSD